MEKRGWRARCPTKRAHRTATLAFPVALFRGWPVRSADTIPLIGRLPAAGPLRRRLRPARAPRTAARAARRAPPTAPCPALTLRSPACSRGPPARWVGLCCAAVVVLRRPGLQACCQVQWATCLFCSTAAVLKIQLSTGRPQQAVWSLPAHGTPASHRAAVCHF